MVLNFVIKVLLYVCLICATIMLLPGWILLDVQPRKYLHRLPNSLNSNENVRVVQFSKIDSINSPESIALFDGKLVTGTEDGLVVQILSDDTVKPLVRIIDAETEKKWIGKNIGRRSRPLGMRFDGNGTLYVVEPYCGVYKVENIFGNHPVVSQVFDIEQTARLGQPSSRFLDDLALVESPSGPVLYITDVSRKFTLEEATLILMGTDTTGRVLRYDINADQLDVILDDLYFPNGIELTTDGSALLLAESATRSVWKIPLTNPSNSKRIMENLPAEVDNIRASSTGHTYWLAMLAPRTFGEPSEMDYFLRKPLLRKLFLRSYHLAGTVLDYLTRWWADDQFFLRELSHQLKTMQIGMMANIVSGSGGMLMEIDSNGTVLIQLHSIKNPDWGHFSEAREIPTQNPERRILYLGSPSRPYLRKIIISG